VLQSLTTAGGWSTLTWSSGLEQQDDATVIGARARRVAAGLGVAPWKIERLLFSFLSVAGEEAWAA